MNVIKFRCPGCGHRQDVLADAGNAYCVNCKAVLPLEPLPKKPEPSAVEAEDLPADLDPDGDFKFLSS